MSPNDVDPGSDDDAEPTRIDPGGGDPSNDPYSQEGLQQAQLDRLQMMATLGMTEEDFDDETIWLTDDDGNIIRDFDDDEDES